LGAGTGLLALAAVRLGARTAVALDLDPEATAAARRHAALNAQRLLVLRGDGGRPLRPGCFDTVVANLTMPLLVERAAEIAALAHPAGRHVLSGFLATDAPAIEAAWPVPARIERRSEGEWGALVLTGLDR
jgi:ribosomal protein L11 methyltransferase